MIDAVTTNAAATIMRRTRMRMKWSSGDIFSSSSWTSEAQIQDP
jgi:hypothetical protein